MTKQRLIPVFLLILLAAEGIVVAMFPASMLTGDNIFVPYFTLITLLFMATYYDSKKALIYAGIFGLLYDVVYIETVGINLVTFLLVTYLFSLLMKVLYDYFFVVIFLGIWAIALVEYYGYGFMLLTGGTFMSHHDFLYHRLIPTVLLNVGFMVVFGYFLKMFFTRLKAEKEERLM